MTNFEDTEFWDDYLGTFFDLVFLLFGVMIAAMCIWSAFTPYWPAGAMFGGIELCAVAAFVITKRRQGVGCEDTTT